MKDLNVNVNFFVSCFTVVIVIIVLFVDNNSLNSLFINYNDNFIIDEVTILDVDYNKVIYSEVVNNNNNNSNMENKNSFNVSNAVSVPVSNVVSKNKVASLDYWAWPTDKSYTITTYYSNSHKALDIYRGYGVNIYAANNGVVTSVKGGCRVGNLSCNGRGGNYVVINKLSYRLTFFFLFQKHFVYLSPLY